MGCRNMQLSAQSPCRPPRVLCHQTDPAESRWLQWDVTPVLNDRTESARERTWQALQHEELRHGATIGQQRGQVQLRDAHRPLLVRRQHVPVPLRILNECLCTSHLVRCSCTWRYASVFPRD